MGIPTEAPSGDTPARGRRLPSFGTLLFIAFAIYWAVRAFGNAGFGGADPTTAPAPGGGGAVGVVTFGTGLDDDCLLARTADRFPIAADVWWRADLNSEQAADAAVVVRSYRDEGQIDRREVPAEPGFGVWDVLCAGEPVPGYQAGVYRVEVWDATESMLLAVGGYSKDE